MIPQYHQSKINLKFNFIKNIKHNEGCQVAVL